jgi:hypothetical protein
VTVNDLMQIKKPITKGTLARKQISGRSVVVFIS